MPDARDLQALTGLFKNYIQAKKAGQMEQSQRMYQAFMTQVQGYRAAGQMGETRERMGLARAQSEREQQLMGPRVELMKEQVKGARVTRETGEFELGQAEAAATLQQEIQKLVRETTDMPLGASVTLEQELEALGGYKQYLEEQKLKVAPVLAKKTLKEAEADVEEAKRAKAQAAEDITKLEVREREQAAAAEVMAGLEKTRADMAVAEGVSDLEAARQELGWYTDLPELERRILDEESQARLASTRANVVTARKTGIQADILKAELALKKASDEIMIKMGYDPATVLVEKMLIEGKVLMTREKILAAIGGLERAAAIIQSKATAAEIVDAVSADPEIGTTDRATIQSLFPMLPGAALSTEDKENAIKRLEILRNVYIRYAQKNYPDMDLSTVLLGVPEVLSPEEEDRLAEEARKMRGTQ